jgi:DNA polymerase-3 subunit delta
MTPEPGKPVYVLQGNDALRRQEIYGQLVDSLLGQADRQLCLSQYDPAVELATVLDELRTLPLLAQHRVVAIRDAEAFISANNEALTKYLKHPANCGTLILLVKKLDGRLAFSKEIPSVGQVISCEAPSGAELVRWITDTAGRLGKTIDRQNASMLAQCVGEDMAALRNELDKLASYVGQRTNITAQDIAEMATNSAAPENFALSNAITRGDVKAGLKALCAEMPTRGAEFKLLGQIAWRIRQALQVHQGIAAGQSPRSAMQAANVYYRDHRDFEALLRRRPQKKLQADMRRLISADLAMKSGTSPAAAMQQLIAELCS